MHCGVVSPMLANCSVGTTSSQLTSVFSMMFASTGGILYSQHNDSHLTFVSDSCLFFMCSLDSEELNTRKYMHEVQL